MTQVLRRKATNLPDPAAMQHKLDSFLALPKIATRHPSVGAGSIAPRRPHAPPAVTPVL
jgi:hypothetical protein